MQDGGSDHDDDDDDDDDGGLDENWSCLAQSSVSQDL